MRILDDLLDRYYSHKVVEIARSHIEDELHLRSVAYFDKVIGEWVIEGAGEDGNTTYTLTYLKFYQRRAIAVLTYLLMNGWTPSDEDFQKRKELALSQVKTNQK